jgi:Aldo/keto reductase family
LGSGSDRGLTGTSTGLHLHYQVEVNGTPVNPVRFMADRGAPLDGKAVAPSRKAVSPVSLGLTGQDQEAGVGLSNHPAWQVTQALWIADDRHLAAAPVCAQVKYNLIDRAAEDELAPACQQFGLSIVPFGPLHGGLLAGMQVEERVPVTRDSVGPGSPTPSWRSAVLSSD